MLVPEILLTVQMVSRIKSRYGGLVAVMHSNLSAGERLDEWKRMKLGLAKIAVGTRTAVFAPFDNIGLIIIDEEQAHTYKSEMSPRYAASAVAKQRAAAHGAALVLSSATPRSNPISSRARAATATTNCRPATTAPHSRPCTSSTCATNSGTGTHPC